MEATANQISYAYKDLSTQITDIILTVWLKILPSPTLRPFLGGLSALQATSFMQVLFLYKCINIYFYLFIYFVYKQVSMLYI